MLKGLAASFVFCFIFFGSNAQDSIPIKPFDSVVASVRTPINYKKRQNIVLAGNIIGYGGTMIALYAAWYSNYPQSRFHFFDDNRQWLQVDKFGHAYSAYIESRVSMEAWRWAGLPEKQVVWIGGLSGAAYQTVIEVLDGFSSEWGWSWGDFAANIAGSGLLVSQELLWKEQRVHMKFSFHGKDYGDPVLNKRADELYGKSALEKVLKDYNNQTYWLSFNINSFVKSSNLPDWLNIALGYGAGNMFGAELNKWSDKQGNNFDYTHLKRYRKFYISPDIDFTRIKTKNKLLKTTFFVLSCFKFPAPAIEFSNGTLSGHWLYF